MSFPCWSIPSLMIAFCLNDHVAGFERCQEAVIECLLVAAGGASLTMSTLCGACAVADMVGDCDGRRRGEREAEAKATPCPPIDEPSCESE